MGNIFISHVISDEPLMREIARGLEGAGYTAWFFERDVLPGTSYLIQITQAIEACDALVLLVTPAALSSDQVTKEVVGAFERRIPFIPVLVDVTPPELKERQPEWRHALGGTAMLCAEEGISSCMPRVVEGLQALGIMPGEEEISTTTPYTSTPRHITNRVLASRSSLEGERKQVTVLFADMVGFTSLSERRDPEEVHEIISPALDIMAEEVYRYEGTVALFTGDGLMALFGAPLAHEDAPHRALYAALAMQRRLGEYAEKLTPRDIELSARIGINTGLVIVGRIGDDLTMEYTALGDTVNLASRMESAAEPGTVQVAENIYRLAEGYFDFEYLGEIEVKGKKEPVRAWRVLGAIPTRGRISASLSRSLSPFVGRELELDLLTSSYQQAKEGHGQVVGIVGEPGAGKSRLLLRFRELIPEDEYTYLEGGCIHFGETIAYLPILEILRSYFDISEGESEAASKRKMDRRLSSLNGQLDHILPPLQELLSLEVDDQAYLSLEPAQRRERVFEAIRYLLVAESQQRPLILAIEDLHWMDKTTEEFLSHLINSIPGVPTLLILLYRPEYTPAWVSKTFYSQVRVDQLPQENGSELVQSILLEGEVSQEISDFIAGQAAGNPLFIEELTRSLLENGCIIKDDDRYVLSGKTSDIEVPDTIQGIIASRLDRLPDELKQAMQVAAVIGREFSLRLLQEVTGISRPLKSYLLQLQSLEFIYEKSLFPEPEYTFKHALTQEVAYNSLLLKRRREIHTRIGKAIESIYADRLEEFHEMLAYHYSRSGEANKAVQYLELSGDKAARSYSNWEAINFYKEAIRLLESQPETQDNKKKKMDICLSTIYPFYLLSYPEGSMEILEKAEKLSEELGDEKALAKVYGILARYHTLRGNASLGLECCEKCFDAAEKAGDVDTMAETAFDICVPLHFVGRLVDVDIISGRVIRLIEEHCREDDIRVGGLMVYSHQCGWRGMVLTWLGEFDEAERVFKRGLEHALEVGDIFGTGWIESFYSMLFLFRGVPDDAIKHARKAIQCFEETGVRFYMGLPLVFLGFGHYILGEYGEAVEYAKKGVKLNQEVGAPIVTPQLESMFALFQLAAGDVENALRGAEEALALSLEYGSEFLEAFALLYLGRVEGEADPSRIEVALRHVRQSMSMCEGMKVWIMVNLGRIYKGEILEKAGRRGEAIECLRKAEEIGVEAGQGYWLDRTREALARLG